MRNWVLSHSWVFENGRNLGDRSASGTRQVNRPNGITTTNTYDDRGLIIGENSVEFLYGYIYDSKHNGNHDSLYPHGTLDGVGASRAQLVTNNAKIDIDTSDIVQLYAKTSNSSLRFNDLYFKEQGTLYNIDVVTTNGQISIHLPQEELKYRLRASTTNGGIFSELRDLDYQINERNYIEANSYGYEESQNKLNLNLQNIQSGIYIKQ